MQLTKAPLRRVRHLLASAACTALVVGGAAALLWGCSRSMFMQSPWEAVPQATPEEIAFLLLCTIYVTPLLPFSVAISLEEH